MLLKNIFNKIDEKISNIEKSKISFFNYFLTLLFLVQIRIFFEMFSTGFGFYPFENWLHQNLYFLSLSIFIVTLLFLFTREKVLNIFKTWVSFFPFVILVPILDLLYNKGETFHISYIYSRHLELESFWERFLTLGGNFSTNGISFGIKVVATIIFFIVFYYIFNKTKSFLRSFAGSSLFYVGLFLYAVLPVILEYEDLTFQHTFSKFFFFLILAQSFFMFWLIEKKKVILIIKDLRFLRVINYILVFVLGAVIFKKDNIYEIVNNLPELSVMGVSLIFAVVFAVANNNIYDIEIDKISNKDRPLIEGKVDINIYKKIMWTSFFISIAAAYFSGFWYLFVTILLMGNYFVYSSPPFRLKTRLFWSKIVISLNLVIMMIAGNYFFEGKIFFSYWVYISFFLVFVMYTNFIDIKDFEGDTKNGSKNLVTLLGLKKSKKVISIFFVLIFLYSNILIFNLYFFFLSIVFSIAQYFFINSTNYKEKFVLLTYLLFWIIFIIFYVFVSDVQPEYFQWAKG